MIFKSRKEAWHTISLGQTGEIEVLVRPPTYDQLCEERETLSGYIEQRIATAIVDWRGVQDEDGNPVKFSEDAVKAACEACPDLLRHLIRLCNEAFLGLDSNTAKNSDAPPSPPSTAAEGGSPSSKNGPGSDD